MIDAQTAQDRCAQALDAARRAGADAAEATAAAGSSEAVTVRLGKIEDVERSEGEEIALRVFVGQRSASVRTSDFTAQAFAEMAERAVAMARLAPEDPYSGLVDSADLAGGSRDASALDLVDPHEPSPELLRDRALAAEDAARAVAGVANSEASAASATRALVSLATSEGFSGGYGATTHALYCGVIAGEGGAMQRDSAQRVARHLEDLPPPDEVGRLAGERAVARLNPAKLPSRVMPVVFDRRISASLVNYLVGSMCGVAAARKATFLLGHEQDELMDPAIRIVEDPHKPRGLRSRPFDGEGVATQRRDLIVDGRMFGWMTNRAAALQLGLPLTGHAGKGAGGTSVSNVDMAPGTISRESMIAEIEDGVLVTHAFGQGVNGVTGDFSRGAAGFRIRNGAIAEAVAEFTIAGNLLDMFARMTPANDPETHRAINVPTLRIDGMTVAGDGE
ncbi:TldD/PmbA family protein [Qipengyuania oceanensis]|uniref:TldD/PmbA family protein n=1 Tax=Qipengyuania oceanensis TaxID=1463597 RepID=A0A844YH58_9SPHN|nr:metallopeptidase TldD-related protein [Qipengyuania oceanensis]MXO62865.1 TldD/PmbA family protein [Qipengyuania oceanensis]